jgi:putative ABC transport system permease protein
MRDFLADVRYAWRALRQSPGFAAIAVTLLALGIGANALVFTLVDGILLHPLPFRDPARLTAIWETTRTWDPKIFASYRDEQVFERQSRSFASLAGWQWVDYTLTGQGDARRVLGEAVTPQFFEVLGVPATQGRIFGPGDESGGPAAVLSDTGWKALFGGAPSVTARSLTLDGRVYRILGVMPPSFEFYPRQVLFWVLLTAQDVARQESAKAHAMGVVGRLRPGVSMASAESELAALRAALEKSDPDEILHAGAMVRGLQEEFTWLAGRGLRSGLLLLFAAVAFVLLIACANVASLLMGRALERRREIAIRAALGAGRGRLIRQILSENLALSALGAVAALALAYAGLRYFLVVQPVELPVGAALALSWRVLLFGALLGVLTAVLSGLLPALQAARFQIHDLLKESGRSASPAAGAQRTRSVLVIFEVALSLALLAGAALLIESLWRLRAEPLGYRLEGLLTARLTLPQSTYPALPDRLRFCERLTQSLAGVPALEMTLRSSRQVHAEVAGAREGPGKASFVLQSLVLPDYFRVTGIPLLAGRPLSRQDSEHSEPVAIVDREFARRYFGSHEALGRHIRLSAASPWRTVVGLAGDIKETNVFDEMHWSVQPHVYLPLWQGGAAAGRRWTLMLRAGPRWLGPDDQPRAALTATLRHAVSRLDAGLPLSEVTSVRHFLDEEAFSKPGFRAALLAIFAALALAMAAMGLYGLLAQLVIQRRHEVGVRMALGAAPADVVRLVVRRNLRLTGLGIALGALGAAAGTRLLRGFLLTGPGRPLVLLGAALLMLAIAALAGLAPAWRAARVDPAAALRDE